MVYKKSCPWNGIFAIFDPEGLYIYIYLRGQGIMCFAAHGIKNFQVSFIKCKSFLNSPPKPFDYVCKNVISAYFLMQFSHGVTPCKM